MEKRDRTYYYTYSFKVSPKNFETEKEYQDIMQGAGILSKAFSPLLYTFGSKITTLIPSATETSFTVSIEDLKNHPTTILGLFFSLLRYKIGTFLILRKLNDKSSYIIDYELVHRNTFMHEGDEFIPIELQKQIAIITDAIDRKIGNDDLVKPITDIQAISPQSSLNYVCCMLRKILEVKKSDSNVTEAEIYLKNFVKHFFLFLPNRILNQYDRAIKEEMSQSDMELLSAISSVFSGFQTEVCNAVARVRNVKNYNIKTSYMLDFKKALFSQLSIADTELEEGFQGKPDILKEICSGEPYYNKVKGFFKDIYKVYNARGLNKTEWAAIFYRFFDECNYKYINDRFKRYDTYERRLIVHKGQFREKCFEYFNMADMNISQSNCEKKVSKSLLDEASDIWAKMK